MSRDKRATVNVRGAASLLLDECLGDHALIENRRRNPYATQQGGPHLRDQEAFPHRPEKLWRALTVNCFSTPFSLSGVDQPLGFP